MPARFTATAGQGGQISPVGLPEGTVRRSAWVRSRAARLTGSSRAARLPRPMFHTTTPCAGDRGAPTRRGRVGGAGGGGRGDSVAAFQARHADNRGRFSKLHAPAMSRTYVS
jgi:hypothetical protein